MKEVKEVEQVNEVSEVDEVDCASKGSSCALPTAFTYASDSDAGGTVVLPSGVFFTDVPLLVIQFDRGGQYRRLTAARTTLSS